MLIILEGPDGSGKSTIAEALYRGLEATQIRQGPPPRGYAFDTFKAIIDLGATSPAPIVADRLHWGAYPYGEVYRGGNELGRVGIRRLDDYCANQSALIVLVTAPADVLNARIDLRGEERTEFEDADRTQRIVDLYDEMYEWDRACSVMKIVNHWVDPAEAPDPQSLAADIVEAAMLAEAF